MSYNSNVTTTTFEVYQKPQTYNGYNYTWMIYDDLAHRYIEDKKMDFSKKYLVLSDNKSVAQVFDKEQDATNYAKKQVMSNDKLEIGVFKMIKSVHVDKPVIVEDVK